jgi:hypothetical protein
MSRVDTVTIVGGGWSAKGYLDRLEGFVIGVNDAALLAPCDAALSMDRLWAENRWDALKARAGTTWLRLAAVKNIPEHPDWLRLFGCDHTSTVMTDAHHWLNGTHSGFCAMNLAYQMRPKRLVLVGFDMGRGPQGQAHWWPDYPWAKPGGATSGGKFRAWAAQFEGAARQFAEADISVEVWGATAIPSFRKAA